MIKLRKAVETDVIQIRELLKKWLIETKLNFGVQTIAKQGKIY